MCLREQVTQSILSRIEQGVGQWQAPWRMAARRGMPTNHLTGHRYSGINVLLLWLAAEERGCERNEWLTFKQAQELGASVRKGSKGVLCMLYKSVAKPGGDEVEGEADAPKGVVPMLKPFWLFNVADVDGLPKGNAAAAQTVACNEAGEALLVASGATVLHGGNAACYSTAQDLIRIPNKAQFSRLEDYYATALHELVHWTGAESRLNRSFGKRFGDDAYAFEELVAELGSAFLMADLGMSEATIQGHADYLGHWVKVLAKDKNAIFSAAKHASAAHQYLMQATQPGGSSVEA